MSSPSLSLPSPTAISPTAFHEALKLYPSLVEQVYRFRLKNDDKKVADALKRDRWRFEELPAAVAADVESATAAAQASKKDKTKKKRSSPDAPDGSVGGGGGRGLAKEDLERLVLWKITHGHPRPFLPAMVRKNDAWAIRAQTSLAFAKLSSSASSSATSTSASASTSTSTPPRPTKAAITEALNVVCKLTGIGPATGTLVLNVFDPVHVPFFQDEMFAWFFPATKADRLKYTLKEYRALLDAAVPVLEKLNVTALQLEQVAYVLGQVDFLEAAERQALLDACEEHEAPSGHESHGPVRPVKTDVDHDAKQNTSAPQQEPPPAHGGRKRAAKDETNNGEEAQAPKRRSQRRK